MENQTKPGFPMRAGFFGRRKRREREKKSQDWSAFMTEGNIHFTFCQNKQKRRVNVEIRNLGALMAGTSNNTIKREIRVVGNKQNDGF